ncbi:MAG: hypothetical protein KC422_15055 [Trueperaceae bacterium]|nr:hypothetical protein [Trueperaceae bacterium]
MDSKSSRLVSIEDIEEFEAAKRIPRKAINSQILKGIRNLNESKELEPFLREILTDATETAHTATEIADILTTHITIEGQHKFAAFVNKGKATPKVTSKLVGHQVLRLHQIPNLDLIVLLAVGDIQDDIKRDTALVAQNSKSDYIFVDATDIARILIAYHKVCPKDGIPYKDSRCPICGELAQNPINVSFSVYEEPLFEVLNDNSHNSSKTRTIKVRTDQHYQKPTLREVIKLSILDTLNLKTFNLPSNEKTADPVSVFLYFTNRDYQIDNWMARALWKNPSNTDNFPELLLEDSEFLGDIAIEWKSDYELLRKVYQEMEGDKRTWFEHINSIYPSLPQYVKSVESLLFKLGKNQIPDESFKFEMAFFEPTARYIETGFGYDSIPPLECSNCHQAFKDLCSKFYDIFAPFSPWENSSSSQNPDSIAKIIHDFEDSKKLFLFEVKKIDSNLYTKWQGLRI